MQVIFTGSRNWVDERIVRRTLERLSIKGMKSISVGDCKSGVDLMVRRWCDDAGIEPFIWLAEWEKYRAAAGPIRNSNMVNAGADMCIGFQLEQSSGTYDCLSKAIAANIETWCFAIPGRRWNRLL